MSKQTKETDRLFSASRFRTRYHLHLEADLRNCPVQSQELKLMVLVDPLQLRIFCNSQEAWRRATVHSPPHGEGLQLICLN